MCTSGNHRRKTRPVQVVLACSALALVAACQRTEQAAVEPDRGEFDWARAALERNPQLEIVAADSNAKVFTVRDKNSGAVLALKLSEVAAAPISQLRQAPAPVASIPSPPQAPAAPGTPAPAAAPDKPSADPTMPQRSAATSSQSSQSPGYTIERTDGQLRVSGPGVSIVSSGTSAARSSSATAQRAVDPIICEGRRMLQLDSRDLYVEGDAITARGGCELYITNSRVVGTNVGVLVQDATVHIANSHIEGASASFIADDGAKVFVRSSTFQGLSRRGERATVQDQGGNRWR